METFNSNWFIFFKEIILKSGKFNLETPVKINQVYEVTFKSINNNINTKIICTIDYLDDLLISINFDNPKTPGLSKYQENEYFYKYDFYENGSHGSPGLEYIELNTKVIKNFLLNGLRGYEIQYFNNGKLNKADLFFESNPLFFNTTVYFENRGCLYPKEIG